VPSPAISGRRHSPPLFNLAQGHNVPPVRPAPRFADFGSESPSPDARHVADWVADSGDNAGGEFVIVDKTYARVYVFDAQARLRGATPVLLGAAP
jgi:hypothetical protein